MKFDFDDDMAQELFNAFNQFGIKLPYRPRLSDHLLDFLTIKKKLIYPQPRIVSYNPEFLKQLPINPKEKEIRHLSKLFEIGKDVNSFQNKRLFQSRFHDHLVYNWNIFHFHLSLQQEKNTYFKKQVKQLLFAMVTNDDVIILGDDQHNKGTFGDVKWLEILHDHFPESISQYKDNRITQVYPDFNSIERQAAWDAGLLLGMTNVRGYVYHHPGVGQATSGHSIMVSKQVNEIMRWLHILKEQFLNHYQAICDFLKVSAESAEFKFQFGSKYFEIIEITSKQVILTYPEVVKVEILCT